ncbi:protein gvpG [Halobacteriales archaeon QS_3_64_16]|nr:MAG: protein gvpG [Halobacteriales archaeon QS_3_64_16]
MTFILDDLLINPWLSLARVLRSTAIQEAYDLEAIQDDIKENQLLYEIGERSEEEYRQRREELELELEVAEQARENLSGQVEVKR